MIERNYVLVMVTAQKSNTEQINKNFANQQAKHSASKMLPEGF